MARRKQEGNRFFRLDVDFFSDKKIKILKARYGADGITLYMYLLCEIYKAGYYLKIDDDFEFIVSDDLNMDSNGNVVKRNEKAPTFYAVGDMLDHVKAIEEQTKERI